MANKGDKSRDQATVAKIQQPAMNAVVAARTGKNPSVDIPGRAPANVPFNPAKGILQHGNPKPAREFFKPSNRGKRMRTY